MAKIIALIVCITLLVGGAVAAVGSIFLGWDIFGEQTTPEHTHQYSEEITKAPTCTEEGVKTFTCSVEGCDKPTYTEPVAKLPHTEVKLEGKAATCTEAGLSEGKKCSACGEITVKQETIPAAGHKEETLAAKAPTCTETGLTAGKKCSVCDSVLEAQSSVPATGHKYDDEYDATCNNEGCDFVRDAACRHSNTETLAAKAATCTETGLTEGLRCKDCEEILTKQEIVPMIAHSWTPATCTAAKSCSVCKATEGDALGHNWKPATCTDPKTCQRENCGVTEGEALGHKWKDATCTAPQICSVCTATQGEALGHKWNAATCDTPNTCSVCKATEGDALGHSYNAATYVWSADNKTCTATKVCKNDPSHVVTETANATIQTASATCTAGGSVTYTATFTKEGFAKQTKSTTIDKLGHAYGETTYSWNIDFSACTAQQKCTRATCSASNSESADITSATTPATCKDPGKIVYTAKFENFASDTRTKVLPVTTNHHYVIDPAVDATCKEPGLTEGKHCDVCGKVEIEQTETALAPHTYDDIYDAECNVCGNIRDAACRHTNTETLDAVAPTCTTAGKTEGKKCLDCDETYVPQTSVPALGHDWAPATCGSPKTCQRANCGATDGAALGHDYQGQTVTYTWNANNSKCTASIVCKAGHEKTETVDVVITTQNPTCTENGLKTYTATFEFEGFATQTKEEAIKTEGHKYTVLVETVAPTCEAKGYTLYKCSGCDNTEQRDWQNSTGHTYGATSYEWNGYETCTATRACVTNGCGHTETATATATGEVTKSSTCTENGTKTYTATFDKAWATVQTKTETLDKLVHGYGDTTYVWAEDYSSCTASRTCANCGTQTATATVTSVTTDPECEKAGKTVYTATFTQDWCETKTVSKEIPALTHSYNVENTEAKGALKSAATCTNQAVYYLSCEHCGEVSTSDNYTFKSGNLRAHNYGDITYSWTGYTACTATRTCQYNDCQHLDSANATVDEGEITTSATCTTAGVKTYTATFDKEGFETQTKTQEIPATGHTFGETVTANDATCILPGNSAYKQCTVCNKYFAADAETNSTDGKSDTTSFATSTIPHDWYHGVCKYECGTPFESTIIFDFGENGEGSDTSIDENATIGATKEYTENGHTLTITEATNVYDGAFDANGNSCLKLGTSKNVATLSFTVPKDVTAVKIYFAGYKAKTSKVTINGGDPITLTTSTNDGEYTAITVDTSVNKTITIATVSGATRCAINTIELNATFAHDHMGGTATCKDLAICDICGKTYGDYAAHTETDVPEVAPKCNAVGYTAGKYCSVCETYTEGHEEQAVVDHSYTNNVCIWCGTSNHTCSFTVEQSVVAPTCTEQGYTVYKCSYEGCTQTENGSYVDANGHTTLAEDAASNEDLVCDACTELIVPVADDTLTIKQANALGARYVNGTDGNYSTDKYYIVATVKEVTNTYHGNMTLVDANDNTFGVYGSYDADGTNKGSAMANQPVKGDTITIYGVIGAYYDTIQMLNGWITAHTAHECVWSNATCQAPKTCSICGATDGDVTDHNYVDGVCSVCGVSKPAEGMTEVTVTVVIGEYATANSWSNSVQYNSLTMDDFITVNVSGGGNTGKYYTSGTNWRIYQGENPSIVVSAKTGATIQSVKITYTVDKSGILTYGGSQISSNTAVTINAGSATFGVGNTGTATNGQVRITAIEVIYSKPADSGSGEGGETPDPTPEEFNVTFNSNGGTEISAQTVVSGNTATKPADPTKSGYVFGGWYTNADCTEAYDFETAVEADITLYAKWTEESQGGGDEPILVEKTETVTFGSQTGTQYADETKTFGNIVVSTHNKGCHFTTQLRLYDSASNDGWAILKAPGSVKSLTINAGYKAATLNVYGSTDGTTWTLIEAVSTKTSYADYTVSIDDTLGYKYIKLDASGNQIRIANIVVTYMG